MKKDTVFKHKMDRVPPFSFDETVAQVFDDMLDRSVPLYAENTRLSAKLARTFYQERSLVYDLGCSHGNFGLTLLRAFGTRPFGMVGIDSSQPMIDRYRKRLDPITPVPDIELVCDRIENVRIENASVAVINLTLQFLDPSRRDRVVQQVFDGLLPGGALLLTEKTIHPDSGYNDLQTAFYESFKRENGYSDLEISQKRDALEKVLIPETVSDHDARLRQAGFPFVDVWLRWFNFVSLIAIKPS